MRLIRATHMPVAWLALCFSFVSLALLPTAFCCRLIAEGGSPGVAHDRCPHTGADGAACPLHRSEAPDGQAGTSGEAVLEDCSADGLLASLFTLTGSMPEAHRPPPVVLRPASALSDGAHPVLDCGPAPHAPPPRV